MTQTDTSGEGAVELLHPFYLDTNMSMAFAAALAGGVSFEEEESRQAGQASEAVRNIEGNLRIFGRFGFGAGREKKEGTEQGSESRLIRQHTEASIFIALYNELQRTGRISKFEVGSLQPGDIVVAELGPAVSPLRRIVEQMIRLVELLASMLQVELPAGADEGSEPPVSRQDRRARERRAAKELAAKSDDSGAELRKMYALFVALQDDLDQSGMIDVVVHREDEPSVVLTLDKRFTDEQAIELLHTSKFTVVGKVTEVLKTDEDAILLYRRSVVGMLPALTKMSMWGMMAILAGLATSLETDDMQKAAYAAAGVELAGGTDADGSDGASEKNGGSGEDDVEPDSDSNSSEELNSEDASDEGQESDDEAASGPDDDEPNLGDLTPLFPTVTGPAIQVLPLAICT